MNRVEPSVTDPSMSEVPADEVIEQELTPENPAARRRKGWIWFGVLLCVCFLIGGAYTVYSLYTEDQVAATSTQGTTAADIAKRLSQNQGNGGSLISPKPGLCIELCGTTGPRTLRDATKAERDVGYRGQPCRLIQGTGRDP